MRSSVRTLRVLLPFLAGTTLYAQDTGTLRGRVTDAATREPVADARVAVEGSSVATTTRANGEYLFPAVPAGHHAVTARRVGYAMARQEVEVAAGDTATLDLALRAAAVALDVVVVTGAAAPTETRVLGNSIATVDGATVTQSQAVTVDAALQGKLAGAQIIQNSGNAGGGGVSVRLRGTSSLISGSEPLYIVDGVIVDNNSDQLVDLGARSNVQNRLADLNPNDVERIEVIRGAAAAALYGSRANNGVVQIFTKRGRAGAPRFSWQTRYSTEHLARHLGMNLYPFDTLGGTAVTRYDYQDYIFQPGHLVDNTLSVEGGDERTGYYLSGAWSDETSILPSNSSSRKGARLNLSQQLYPTLRVTLGANFVNTHNEFEPNGEQTTGVITGILFTPTTYSYFPVNGVYPRSPAGATFANPLDVLANWRAPQDVNRFTGSARARFTPTSRLALEYTVGYDGYQLEVGQFIPRNSLVSELTGRSTDVVRDSRIINNDGVATFDMRASDRVGLRTSLGFNHTWQRQSTVTASARDLLPGVEVVGAGGIPAADQRLVEFVTLGFYAQEAVTWRDRLYVTGALRWDASSTFGPDSRWQLYPKLSGSYVVSDEAWFAGSPAGRVLSSLRLRAALGYAGNQPSAANAYSRFDNYVKAVNSDRTGVVNSTTLGNPDLKPERQREWEIGADMGFRADRASVEFTYYNKLVTDLLLFRPLTTSTGYVQRFENIGTMSNKGLELAIRSINLDGERIRWRTSVTYSRNRNRIATLSVAPFTFGYINRVQEGQPVGVFFGETYRRDTTGAIAYDSLGRPIRSRTSAVIGDPNPDWLGSILNEVDVGRHLTFRVLIDGSFGGDVLNLTRRIQDVFGTGADAALEAARILPKGYLAARLPIFEEYVENGSFTKLREVSLTYRLAEPLARRVGAKAIDLTVAGRNLHTWTDYRGYDPEMNLFGQRTVERGNDFATVPIPRAWTFSARVTF